MLVGLILSPARMAGDLTLSSHEIACHIVHLSVSYFISLELIIVFEFHDNENFVLTFLQLNLHILINSTMFVEALLSSFPVRRSAPELYCFNQIRSESGAHSRAERVRLKAIFY